MGLRVVADAMAQSIYDSMISIDGLRPCDFTIPNFPDCAGAPVLVSISPEFTTLGVNGRLTY